MKNCVGNLLFWPENEKRLKRVLQSLVWNRVPMHTFVFSSDMTHGRIGDMSEMGVTESYQVKKQVLVSAAEAAEMILRVDDIVKAAPRYSL